MVLKTDFGWVLSGAVNAEKQQGSETCCLVTTGADSETGQGSQLDNTTSLEMPSGFWPVVCSRCDQGFYINYLSVFGLTLN